MGFGIKSFCVMIHDDLVNWGLTESYIQIIILPIILITVIVIV